MRRIFLVLTVAALTAAMMVFAAPAAMADVDVEVDGSEVDVDVELGDGILDDDDFFGFTSISDDDFDDDFDDGTTILRVG